MRVKDMNYNYLIFGASSDVAVSYIKHLDECGGSQRIFAFCRSSAQRLEELELQNTELRIVVCDLTDSAALEQEIKKITDELSQLGEAVTHFLHFAAGQLVYDKIPNFSAERFCASFQIQVSSAMTAMKFLLPIMKKRKFGRIIIMTSSCTIGTPPKYMAEYTAVKYALAGVIKSAAVEYAGKNITVNGIAPAMIETRFWDTVSPHIKEMNLKSQPGGECISMAQIHSCLDYLGSESASFVTGENINLSGGQTI